MNKIRQLLWNVISSGLPEESDIETRRKVVLQNIMFLVGAPCLILFLFVAYSEGNILLAVTDSLVIVLLITLFVYLRKTGNYLKTGGLGVTAAGIFFLFQIANGGVNQIILIWSLTYPLIALFLLGHRRGSLMSLIFLGLAITIFLFGEKVSWMMNYSIDIIIRYLAVYILIFFFSFTMEEIRHRVHRQIEVSNQDLQKALAKVQEGTSALAKANLELQFEINERKQAEEALKNLSIKDDLTGLYNRRGFFALADQGLKMAQRTGKEMTLMFADVDNMKKINDTLGHQEGDKALMDVSRVLKETFRESDIIARIGGDEFVILAMDRLENSAEILISRFQQVLDKYNFQAKNPYTLSLSMGIAYFDPNNPHSIDALLAQADRLMYINKDHKSRMILSQKKGQVG